MKANFQSTLRFCCFLAWILSIFLLPSCKKETNEPAAYLAYADENELRPGGIASTADASFNAFGQAAPGISSSQASDFVVGNSFFKLNWVAAPASTAERDGLGPLFNAASCSGCHVLDGRGLAPETEVGESGAGLLIRVSGEDPSSPHPLFGGQLQTRALQGRPAEARVLVQYLDSLIQYPDGNSFSVRKPAYTLIASAMGDPGTIRFSPRLAPQMIGMGLLEAIPETDLLQNEDPNDRDGDGISGRANWVADARTGQKVLGRFGWKAGKPTVEQQTAAAFAGDIGITSHLFPKEEITESQQPFFAGLPLSPQPEISDELLRQVVWYSAILCVPERPSAMEKPVLEGKKLFMESGCGKCHVPRWTTGNVGIQVLANQVIFPYTDLLLHDMGAGLADYRHEAAADGKEWRTPPLWGISKIKIVNKKLFLLHDGRARSVEEALLWHGGEAEKSRQQFLNLTKPEREQLLRFLEQL